MTQRIDNFLGPGNEIFEPTIESKTLELFSGDRGNPIFELFAPLGFERFDRHSTVKDSLFIIDDQTHKFLIIFSRHASERLRLSVHPDNGEKVP